MTAWPPFQLEKFALVIVKGERPGEEHPISPSVLALLAERKVATENDATKLLLQAHFVSKQFGFVSAKVCFRLISPPAPRRVSALGAALMAASPCSLLCRLLCRRLGDHSVGGTASVPPTLVSAGG